MATEDGLMSFPRPFRLLGSPVQTCLINFFIISIFIVFIMVIIIIVLITEQLGDGPAHAHAHAASEQI